MTGIGYGCAMTALIDSWRKVWARASTDVNDHRIFGIATLASKTQNNNIVHRSSFFNYIFSICGGNIPLLWLLFLGWGFGQWCQQSRVEMWLAPSTDMCWGSQPKRVSNTE